MDGGRSAAEVACEQCECGVVLGGGGWDDESRAKGGESCSFL